ncbi:hypothetical protein, partial [Brevundimonas sp.]|uniref:hypothetical protein n=1 Tax=Brevundimonas sp. TaxID=1871086 RepID=UPI0024880331
GGLLANTSHSPPSSSFGERPRQRVRDRGTQRRRSEAKAKSTAPTVPEQIALRAPLGPPVCAAQARLAGG